MCASNHSLRCRGCPPGPPPATGEEPQDREILYPKPRFLKKSKRGLAGMAGARRKPGSSCRAAHQRGGAAARRLGRGQALSGDPRPAPPGSPRFPPGSPRPLGAERAAAERRPSPHGPAPAPPPPAAPAPSPAGRLRARTGRGPRTRTEPQALGPSPRALVRAPRPRAEPRWGCPCPPPELGGPRRALRGPKAGVWARPEAGAGSGLIKKLREMKGAGAAHSLGTSPLHAAL